MHFIYPKKINRRRFSDLKREILFFNLYFFLLFREFSFFVNFVPFHVHGLIGLTGHTCSQAPQPIQIAWFTSGMTSLFLNGTICTAFVGQCSEHCPAVSAIGKSYTVFFYEYRFTGLYKMFLCNAESAYRSGRTGLSAYRAVIIAVSCIKIEKWLHHSIQPVLQNGRLEY